MDVVLTHEETNEAMAFYLQEKYNIGGNAVVDIVKQPKTGNITTTVTFTPSVENSTQATATKTSEPDVVPEADEEPPVPSDEPAPESDNLFGE